MDSRSSALPVPRPSVMTAMSSRSGSGAKLIASSSSMSARILGTHAAYSWSQLAK